MSISYVFEKVATKRKKFYVDEDGKKRQKTKEFYQTISPFNRNNDGLQKSREEIQKEILIEAEAWLKCDE